MRAIYKTNTGIEFYENSPFHEECIAKNIKFSIVFTGGEAVSDKEEKRYKTRRGISVRMADFRGNKYIVFGCSSIINKGDGIFVAYFGKNHLQYTVGLSKNLTTCSGGKRIFMQGCEMISVTGEMAVIKTSKHHVTDEKVRIYNSKLEVK